MNIRVKFDNTRVKIGQDGRVEINGDKGSVDEGAFCEVNLDFLYMAYRMFPKNLFSIDEVVKSIEKYGKLAAQVHEKTGVIPEHMHVNGHDIYNYIARYGAANYQIQAVMRLNGKLDPAKLKKAVRLSLDAEPVFGCRLVENDPPYWKRLPNIDDIDFCTFEKTYSVDDAIQRFLETPLDMDKDPMIKLRLISSPSYDTLCLKINHSCCDGTGTKEYIQLLSSIYSVIDQDKGSYKPKPRLRTRRDQDRLFDALGIKEPGAAWDPSLEGPKNLWEFPWKQGKPGTVRVAACKLPNGYINVMSKYAKARGATVNDLILAGLYRAMFKMSRPEENVPMDISMTVDLRRYLPDQKTDAIRNFSGGFDTQLSCADNEPFERTLSRVALMMKEIKKGRPGLQSAVGLERVEKGSFFEILSYYQTEAQNISYSDKCSPVLSNLGLLSKDLIKFGKTAVTNAYIVPPAVSAPGILICVGTYNGVLTFTISYFEAQARGDDVNRLLNLIKNELMKGCGYIS